MSCGLAVDCVRLVLDDAWLLLETGEIVVGTPDDAIRQIRRLEEKVPDFGCLLMLDKNWASQDDKKRSMEMMMRYVLPAINGDNRNRQKSFDWARDNRDGFIGVIQASTKRAFEKHAQMAEPVDASDSPKAEPSLEPSN